MDNYMEVANHWTLWIAGAPLAILTVVQGVLFLRKALKVRKEVDLTKDEAMKALRVGATASIGPAFGVFVVMLGLMAAIGAPFAWMRLTTIGSAPIQLSAAQQAAEAMGTTLGGEGYGAVHFANAAWVLSLNGMSWLIVTGLFAHKMDDIKEKVSCGDPRIVGVLGSGAMIGAFAYLFSSEFFTGLERPDTAGYLAALLASGVSMIGLSLLAKKYPKLAEYNLGIAMIIGMAAAVIVNNFVGY